MYVFYTKIQFKSMEKCKMQKVVSGSPFSLVAWHNLVYLTLPDVCMCESGAVQPQAAVGGRGLTAHRCGLMPRYFPLPQPTSARTAPGGSKRRKSVTRGQGEWRVLLKWEEISSYTRCTNRASRRDASPSSRGRAGAGGTSGGRWLSQADGYAARENQLQHRSKKAHALRGVSCDTTSRTDTLTPQKATHQSQCNDSHRRGGWEDSPQLHAVWRTLRNVKDVLVARLLRVRSPGSGVTGPELTVSPAGTTSNFLGVILASHSDPQQDF